MKHTRQQTPGSTEISNGKHQNRATMAGPPWRSRLAASLGLGAWCLVLLFLLPLAQAQPTRTPPGQISYQGFLTDANGIALATNAPRNYTIVFRIYDSSSSGILLWAEQQIVTVDRGYFTVMLGAGTSYAGQQSLFTNNLSGLFSGATASDRYIGTTVNDLSFSEIVPRLRLLASPYSFLASKAVSLDSSASVADSSLSPNVALRNVSNTFTGHQFFTAGDLFMDNASWILAKNNVGVYENFLYPRWTDNVTYLNYGSGGFNIRNNNSATAMFMDPNGNIGIGNQSPTFPLTFAASLGDKLALYQSVGNTSYGFGVQSYQLQIHTDTSLADVVFGYGSSPALTETMRIKGSGKVGIGASSPGKTLQVGDANVTGSEGMIRLGSRSSVSGSGASRTWDIGVPQTADVTTGVGYSFVINDGATTDFLVQYNSGNVGIGTTTPANKLQVGNLYESAAGYGLVVASPQYGENIQMTNYTGYGLLVDYLGNNSFIQAAQMLTVRNNGASTFNVFANGDCYAKSFNPSSDRNAKENFQPISPEEVLDKVASLPIQEWNFKTDETRHIGPMAQDFYAAFGVGPDDKHIATVDADGVALAAIQGLNKKLEAKENEITELKARLDKLEKLLSHDSNGAAR